MHDEELDMMAFYAVRGYSIEELVNLSETEKIFLACAREKYYKEEADKYNALLGG